MDNNKERNYGIDILRILAMVMVVTLHILGKGDLLYNENLELYSIQYKLLWMLETMAYCAVNCYAMISGFVGVKSKHKYTNIIMLWLQVVFYCVLIASIFSYFNISYLSRSELIKYIFPVINSKYWYFTAYFALFFFMPILNNALLKIEKSILQKTLCALFLVMSILPLIQKEDIFLIHNGYHILWLMYLYLIGGYIALYPPNKIKFFKLTLFVGYIFTILITFFMKSYNDYLTFANREESINLLNYTSPTIFFAALFLLLIFANLNIKYFKKIITLLSSLCFAIYLIHEHEIIREHFIINKFSHLLNLSPIMMLTNILFIIISICILCMIVEFIRQKIFSILHIKQLFIYLENLITNNRATPK